MVQWYGLAPNGELHSFFAVARAIASSISRRAAAAAQPITLDPLAGICRIVISAICEYSVMRA
jgi:hypothetical protein